jgi:CBS domain-containing protein
MDMNVEEIMTRDVITVTPETPVHKAAQLMVDHGVSGLPVIDGDALVGVISEGDLILRQRPRRSPGWWRNFFADPERLAREYRKAAGTTVGEVMTRAVVSVSPAMPIESAAGILHSRGIRRLPVTVDGLLVGIVSRGDLVKAVAMAIPHGISRSDAELITEMRARMARERWISPFAVGVEAKEGVISLWGLANSDAERAALTTMARAIEGCRGVENHVGLTASVPHAYGI